MMVNDINSQLLIMVNNCQELVTTGERILMPHNVQILETCVYIYLFVSYTCFDFLQWLVVVNAGS